MMNGSLFYKPKRPNTEKEVSKKRWNIGAIVWKVLKRTCMTLGALVLFSAILGTISTIGLMNKAAPPLPDEMVLVLKVEDGIAERASQPTFLDPFPFAQPTVRQIVDALDAASKDPRVKSFVLNYRGGSIALSHIQEVRPAIERFRASGKKAYIYASSYANGSGTGLGTYYLASSFDEIWMQPVGMVSIAGINMEMPFGRKVLEKIGVQPAFFQREEYKSAMENMARDNMSPANREAIGAIVNSLSRQILSSVSQDRDIAPKAMKALIDQGLFSDTQALSVKLIDRLDYGDVLMDELRQNITGSKDNKSLEFIPFHRYAHKVTIHKEKMRGERHLAARKNGVALVYAVGQIDDGSIRQTKGKMNAAEIANALRDAADDKTIETIVLRVDSPGGSPSASETIRRAVLSAQEKGKRVSVSMGSVAASGGYWISTPADKIYALPSTLTGSIGVIMGKFVIADLLDKVGITIDGVQWGDNVDLLSFNKDFDESQKRHMNDLIDATYQSFLQRVSEGRKMSVEDVRNVAKGRPWTGEQAIKIGLVDALGGLDVVLNDVAKEQGLRGKDDLNIVVMPKPQTPFEQFFDMFGEQVALGRFFKNNTEIMDGITAASEQIGVMLNAPAYSVYDPTLETLR